MDAAVVTPVKPADGAGAAAPVGDGRQAAFQRSLQGLVGQQVSAEVMSKLNDGTYLVKVADNAVRMMLPPDVQVGAEVPLTVLSATPRPTFQLGTGNPGSAATVVYSDHGAADAGDGLYSPNTLPSQDAPVTVPGGGRPAAGTPGQPGAAPGDGAEAAAGGAPAGQAKPGADSAAQAAGKPALQAGAAAGTGVGAAAPGEPADAAASAAQAGKPGATAAGATNPVLAQPATTASAAAAAAAALASGKPAAPDAVKPQSLAATLLGKAPLTPSNELPELDATTPQSTLSSAARALTTVLSAAQGGGAAQTALVGKTPLFGSALPPTDQLAQKLHDTISQSGLFYESHVTEWVKGERALPELMREPQMQRLAQGAESAARAAANGPDLSSAQMINQQLHTQEQGRVQWHGEAWPGQAMQWEIRRDQRQGGQQKEEAGGDGEAEQIWRSGVRFRFPTIGTVSASVTLIGGQIHIQVQTGSEDSADTLRAYAGQLEGAMEAAGAPLTSLTIAQEGGHEG